MSDDVSGLCFQNASQENYHVRDHKQADEFSVDNHRRILVRRQFRLWTAGVFNSLCILCQGVTPDRSKTGPIQRMTGVFYAREKE